MPRAGQNDSCQALTSVFRMTADECGRLWVIDSGAVDAIGDIRVVCPPQIVIFDLNTDKLLWRYVIPKSQVRSRPERRPLALLASACRVAALPRVVFPNDVAARHIPPRSTATLHLCSTATCRPALSAICPHRSARHLAAGACPTKLS